MDNEELIRWAESKMRQGESRENIDAFLQERFGTSIADLRISRSPASAARSQGGNMDLTEILRMAAQGATFEFGDELAGLGAALIPGGRGYEEARDASRANVERIRSDHPVQATLAEIAGGLAIPGIGAAKGVYTASRPLRSAARLAATGAAEGALFGAGASEEGDRTGSAILGGTVGAMTGLASGVPVAAMGAKRNVRSMVEAAKNPGPRVAGELRDLAGVSDIEAAVEPYLAAANRPPRVSTSDVRARETERILDAIDPEWRTKYPEPPKTGPARPWELRNEIPRGLGERVESALESGRAMWNKGSQDVAAATANMTAEQRQAFSLGSLQQIIQRLESNDEEAVRVLKRFRNMGPDRERALRSIFPSQDAYEEFAEVLKRENRAAELARALPNVEKSLILGAVGQQRGFLLLAISKALRGGF